MRIDEPENPAAPGPDGQPPAEDAAGGPIGGPMAHAPTEPAPLPEATEPAPLPEATEDLAAAAPAPEGSAAEVAAVTPAPAPGPSLARRAIRLVRRAGGELEELVARLAVASPRLFVWPGLIAVCAAAGMWMLTHTSRLAEMNTNKLGEPERAGAQRWFWVALAAYAVVFLLSTLAVRLRSGAWRPMRVAGALPRWLSFLVALPLIGLLRLPSIERESPKLTIFLVVCGVVACLPALSSIAGLLVRRRREEVSEPDVADEAAEAQPSLAERVGRWAGPMAIAMLWAWYGWFFSRFAITNHRALNTRTTDLGYYDNIFWQSIHGNFLGCSFLKGGTHTSAHFDPLLVLLSPIYLLSQRAETILILQAVWLGAGVVPIYLLAMDKLRSRLAGVAIALCYAFYPALHGATMYEFHSLSLVTPLVLWLVYFLEARKAVGYWLFFLFAILLREDIPLLLCFVGLYAILMRRPGSVRQGIVTIVLSLAYFLVVKKHFMASEELLNTGTSESYGFGYYYDAMIPAKNGATGLVTSLLTNPAFVLKHIIDETKIQFLLLLFVPLAFVPFLARRGRVMLVYGLVFCLLASRGAVFTIHFQYSSLLFAVAFALVPAGLARLSESTFVRDLTGVGGRRVVLTVAGAMVLATTALSCKFGGLVENASFKGGYVRVTRTLTDEQRETYAWVKEQLRTIPRRASVGASPKLGPHVSNRKDAYYHTDKRRLDFLFVDEGELKAADLERHQKNVEKSFNEVARRGKLVLFKRK